MQNILYDLISIVKKEEKINKLRYEHGNIDYLKTLQFDLTTTFTNYKSRDFDYLRNELEIKDK